VIPPKLREAFADAGQRLPKMWENLSVEAKKSLLRTLIDSVNLRRRPNAAVQIRIVWRGGLVSDQTIRVPVRTLHNTELEEQLVQRIRQLTEEGLAEKQIADRLNQEGFTPCRGPSFTTQVVTHVKCVHGIVSNRAQVRRGELASFAYTLQEMARLLEVAPHWFHRRIKNGIVKIEKDPRYGCYLFPKDRGTVEQLKRLKTQKVCYVSIQRPYSVG